MKTLLVAVNAKFTHTNLAVRCLSDYCADFDIDIYETNINVPYAVAVDEILAKKADIVGFSTYIFNIDYVTKVVADLRLLTAARILFGGPEAGGNPDKYLSLCDNLIAGEGEAALKHFLSSPDSAPRLIYGTPLAPAQWTRPTKEYTDSARGKIVYYESTRGCPYKCTYCLSSSNGVYTERPLNSVMQDLDFFIGREVKQVKFVDRTFNANLSRAKKIFEYLIQKNPRTAFHMEMAPDLFDDELFELLASARPALFQFEIGIQTFCVRTLALIRRAMDIDKATQNIRRVLALKNIHTHVDLIFGLPEEGIAEVRDSLNRAYLLAPHTLQLGFLKILGGTPLVSEAKQYGIAASKNAPYETLYTSALSHEDMTSLKKIERAVDYFFNDKKFAATLRFFASYFATPFEMWLRLGEHLYALYGREVPLGLEAKTALLFSFAKSLEAPQNRGGENDKTGTANNLSASLTPPSCFETAESCIRYDILTNFSGLNLLPPLKTDAIFAGQKSCQMFVCDPVSGEQKPTVYRFDYTKKDPVSGLFHLEKIDTADKM